MGYLDFHILTSFNQARREEADKDIGSMLTHHRQYSHEPYTCPGGLGQRNTSSAPTFGAGGKPLIFSATRLAYTVCDWTAQHQLLNGQPQSASLLASRLYSNFKRVVYRFFWNFAMKSSYLCFNPAEGSLPPKLRNTLNAAVPRLSKNWIESDSCLSR